MGQKSQIETLLRIGSSSNEKQTTALAQESKKYLYNIPTAKYMKGYELLYREKEYMYWYMGNINFLIQFYTFWKQQPSEILGINRHTWFEWSPEVEDLPMVHAPVAGFITDLLRDLVISGDVEVRITGGKKVSLNERVQAALKDNDFQNLIRRAFNMQSWGGTIAFKANFDKEISEHPILEVYEAPRLDYKERFSRITDIETIDHCNYKGQEYVLITTHNRKGIQYSLWKDGSEVDLDTIPEFGDLKNFEFGTITNEDGTEQPKLGPILAVWFENAERSKEFYDMHLGASDYEGILDFFHMADEIFSRFIGQIRATQPMLFMSEELMGWEQLSDGTMRVKKPKNFGARIIELSGGLSNVDGRSIQAMFSRDVPDINSDKLQEAFEWVLRQALKILGIAPSSGNVATETIGSNTTSAAMFKREQSTHLVRKNRVSGWTVAIQGIVKLLCQYFDIMDGKTVGDYADLEIDVIFPEIDADDFNTRMDMAIKGFTAGLFDITSGVDYAMKYSHTKTERENIIKTLEREREEALQAEAAKLSMKDPNNNAAKLDKVNKVKSLNPEAKRDAK